MEYKQTYRVRYMHLYVADPEQLLWSEKPVFPGTTKYEAEEQVEQLKKVVKYPHCLVLETLPRRME